MNRVGIVLHVSPSHNIIMKAQSTPKIGETVVDENLKPIGKVFDILGPVSAPYVEIKPIIDNPERTVDKPLYVIPSRRRKEKNRYG